MKHCSRCQTTKPAESFYLYKGKPRGYCKTCAKEYATEYQRKQVNITPEQLMYAREYAAKMRDKHMEFIYLAGSPTFGGYIKIGRTTKPTKRLVTFNTHTPFKDFEFLRVYKVNQSRKVEADLLDIVSQLGTQSGEWVKIDAQTAIKLSDKIVKAFGGSVYE
jgi:hypothetical protein